MLIPSVYGVICISSVCGAIIVKECIERVSGQVGTWQGE